MEKFISLCSLLLMVNGYCCNDIQINQVTEPEHLAKYHKDNWYITQKMPKTVEDIDKLLENYVREKNMEMCYSNDSIWGRCDCWVCCEIVSRIEDQDTYFIDTYLERFDKLMQWASMEKYSAMMTPLFHRGKYGDGLVDHLWSDICLVRLNNPNISKEIIFRVMKGLDTSLRRVPVYIKDYVEKNADLMWCYNTMIAGDDFGPDSEIYKQISKIVEDMLIGGIPLIDQHN